MSLMVGMRAMAMTIIAMMGTSPAEMVDVTSEPRSAITNAMIAATRVMTQNIFTAGSCTRAPSGPLIICGVTKKPPTPMMAMIAIETALHQRTTRARSQEETYSAISSAIGGIIAIM